MFNKNRKTRRKDAQASSINRIKKQICKSTSCYVLITCTQPDKDGKIEVEMIYEGDRVLAAYLIKSAQDIFEGETEGATDSGSDLA